MYPCSIQLRFPGKDRVCSPSWVQGSVTDQAEIELGGHAELRTERQLPSSCTALMRICIRFSLSECWTKLSIRALILGNLSALEEGTNVCRNLLRTILSEAT